VRARELGLTNTRLKNSTGLPDPEHKMSVRDLARLASHIIREFPEYYAIYGELDFEFNNIRQANRNPLLQAGIEGVDGVKTGHTSEAGYGLVASAIRGDRRLVLVVAGLDSIRQRRAEAERLLEHGFRDFIEYRVFEAGAAVAEANVWLGAASTLPLVPAEPVAVTLTRETRRDLAVKLRYKDWVPAPVARGDRLGEVVIELPGRDPIEVPLVAGADVEEAGMLGRLTGLVQHLVVGP
jgi:D-alanyl-D-alanine carboxypeptidase (penicillin-binding protein 5/6)